MSSFSQDKSSDTRNGALDSRVLQLAFSSAPGMSVNPTIFQAFEWNLPHDQQHYNRLSQRLPALNDIGVTALWLPPAAKAGNSTGNGYDVYDLYDLGEFDQRGSRATKWGQKEDLIALTSKANDLNVGVYFDAVLNHRCGGDAKETINAVQVDPNNRNKDISPPEEIEAWLQYNFSGRDGKYSTLKYDWRMFNAADWDDRKQKSSIYKIIAEGKNWASDVSKEDGNGDYLMFNNLDYTNQALSDDVKKWGVWVAKELQLSGFRLDAMQHISQKFTTDWIKHVRKSIDRKIFIVGEYWNGDVKNLTDYLGSSPPDLHLYDVPLVYNLANTSWSKSPDLRKIFDGTLVKSKPNNAVTLVMNHDTQKGQTMDTPVNPNFTSHAYSLVLLRQQGYPCVFYGDMFGIAAPFPSPPTCNGKLADLVLARHLYAYGEQQDYFENANFIGWVRRGDARGRGSHMAGMAVVMSWDSDRAATQQEHAPTTSNHVWRFAYLERRFGKLRERQGRYQTKMNVGARHAGEVWTDILGGSTDRVTISQDGTGVFPCRRNTVAIYTSENAGGRDRFPVNFESDIQQY